MKKIEKLILADAKLTSEELKLLKGGERNINNVIDCTCTYDNGPSLVNKNNEQGCSCECVGY
jgi:natural product precursor